MSKTFLTEMHGQSLAMEKDTLLSIERPLGRRIDCLRGTLWITHDGDARDFFVCAGEQHVADRRARVLVQALQAGVVRVDGPGARWPAARGPATTAGAFARAGAAVLAASVTLLMFDSVAGLAEREPTRWSSVMPALLPAAAARTQS